MNHTIDYGRDVYRLGGSWLIDARSLKVGGTCWALALVLAAVGLTTGSAGLSLADLWSVATGGADEFTRMVILEWRAPRIGMAIVVGASLALSGAIFQKLTNNPLGSPDVIGFQTGSFTGALIVMLLLHGGAISIMFGALFGGVATAIGVFALSKAHTVRLIIVGIAASAMLASLNTWILLNASVENAIMAGLWGAGNLSGVSWTTFAISSPVALMFVVLVILARRELRINSMGQSFATALGQRVRLVQAGAIVVGIGLTALATSTVGPVSFIALAAPQIAHRLVRTDDISLGAVSGVGAALLLGADIVAQHIYPPSPLPVGIVTTSIGGAYFLWLLMREGKK